MDEEKKVPLPTAEEARQWTKLRFKQKWDEMETDILNKDISKKLSTQQFAAPLPVTPRGCEDEARGRFSSLTEKLETKGYQVQKSPYGEGVIVSWDQTPEDIAAETFKRRLFNIAILLGLLVVMLLVPDFGARLVLLFLLSATIAACIATGEVGDEYRKCAVFPILFFVCYCFYLFGPTPGNKTEL
jgi:hypothetical protein